jgi:tetratricopeptide (TPR) repeat protein
MDSFTPGYVPSNFFIERPTYQQDFENLLHIDSKVRMLNIHSNGDGGIGKTRLLLKMVERCKINEKKDIGSYTQLIDFYHASTQSKNGLIEQLLIQLSHQKTQDSSEDIENNQFRFSKSWETIQEIKSIDSENIPLYERIYQQLEECFFNEYKAFCNELEKKGQIAVLFFDTYEFIQSFDDLQKEPNKRTPKRNYLTHWLETSFFVKLLSLSNIRIIVAGRYPLKNIAYSSSLINSVQEINLTSFNKDETFKFLNFVNFLKNGQQDLVFQLTGGHPILLALFVDRLIKEGNIDSFELFLKESQEESEFRQYLIEPIIHDDTEEANFIRTIAFAHLRMTPEMYAYIWEEPLYRVEYLGDETRLKIYEIFRKLGGLSFIKTKNKGLDYETIVLLHDEVRELIVKYYWKVYDENEQERKSIAQTLVEYYDTLLNENETELEEEKYKEKLSPNNRTALISERLYYLMWVNPERGVSKFEKEFDARIQREYELEVCASLVGRVEIFEALLSPLSKAKFFLRRLDLYNRQYLWDSTLSFFKDNPIEHIIGQISYPDKSFFEAHFKLQHAIAYHWKGQFEDAILLFGDAEKFFRGTKDENFNDFIMAAKWLGYAHYTAGNYLYAENIFNQALREFASKLREGTRNLLFIEIANIYSNMNVLLRATGKFYTALMYAEVAISIAREQNDQRELLRFLNAYAGTCLKTNRLYDAEQTYQECESLLENMLPDVLLRARVLQGRVLLFYNKYHNVANILLNYGNHPFRVEIIRTLKKEEQLPTDENLKKLEEASVEKKDDQYWLANNHFYCGEAFSLLERWDEALAAFNNSIEYAKNSNHYYIEIAAEIGKLSVYCYGNCNLASDSLEETKKHIHELLKKRKYYYYYLKGKLSIIEGDFNISEYQQTNNFKFIQGATRCFINACNEMYKFDKYFNYFDALRGMQKRLTWILADAEKGNDLDQQIKKLSDVWVYDEESELDICKLHGYSDRFSHIIEHILALRTGDQISLDNKVLFYTKQIEDGIERGKDDVRFAPLYGEMLVDIQEKKQDNTGLAIAWRMLGRAYRYNDRVIRSQHSYEKALEYAEEIGNKLLAAELCVELGANFYHRGEYEKALEFYRQDEIIQNNQSFIQENKLFIESADKYFEKAKLILKNISSSEENEANRVRALLDFKYGEYLVITQTIGSEPNQNIINLFTSALNKAIQLNNIRLAISALQSLITYYYLVGSKADDNLSKQLDELYSKEGINASILMGKHLIAEGNVIYDQLFSEEDIREKLKQSFKYYIRASDYKLRYSEKFFYEAIQIIFRRIANLPVKYIPLLQNKFSKDFLSVIPNSKDAEEAYELIGNFISIRKAQEEVNNNGN